MENLAITQNRFLQLHSLERGKTGLKSFLMREFKLPRFIEFNPDEIAIYHKHYREIIHEFPDDSYRILQRFVQPALDEYLRPKAVDSRFNIMQEGTFASTDGYLSLLRFQKYGGSAPIRSNVSKWPKRKKICRWKL